MTTPTPAHPLDLAAMAAYGAFAGNLTDQMFPAWEQLPPEVRADWRAVADAVLMVDGLKGAYGNSNLPPEAMTARAGRVTGLPLVGIEHPADGTWSPSPSGELRWELCNGMLLVESYTTDNPGERRARLTDQLSGTVLTLCWEQWEDLKEAIEGGTT